MRNKQAAIVIIVIFLTSISAVLLFNTIVNGKPNFIRTCSEAKARRLTNIPESSVYYRSELDDDGDGTACNV